MWGGVEEWVYTCSGVHGRWALGAQGRPCTLLLGAGLMPAMRAASDRATLGDGYPRR